MKSDVPMLIADAALPDTTIVIANDPFCEMSGYRREEILGRNCRFLQPPGNLETIRERMRRFQSDETRDQADFILPNARKDGTRFLNLLYMCRLAYPDRPPLFLGSQFDVTTQTSARLLDFSATLKRDVAEMNRVLHSDGWTVVPPFIALDETLARIANYAFSEG